MKFIKAIIVTFLLVIAAMLLIGVFVPEVDERMETRIEAPVISVYTNFLNVSMMDQWVDGLQSIELQNGMLGLPGSTYKLIFEDKETTSEFHMEILENTPMKSVRMRFYNKDAVADVSVSFKSDGAAFTNMATYVQIKGKSILGRSFVPLMKTVLMDDVEQDLTNFKELQEQ